MEAQTLLLIALVMYIIGIYTAKKNDLKILFVLSGMLWFIPVFVMEDTFIIIFSIVMFISHILIAFYSDKESEY